MSKDLFNPVKLKSRSEEILEKRNVEEITGDGVVLSDWVSKLDALIVHRFIDSLVVKEVRKIFVQESDELFHVHRRRCRSHFLAHLKTQYLPQPGVKIAPRNREEKGGYVPPAITSDGGEYWPVEMLLTNGSH